MLYKGAGLLMVALVVTLLLSSGCEKNRASANSGQTYQYTVPAETTDGWQTAPVSSENLEAALVQALFERVRNNTYTNIHSVLLVKNGKLVVEEYFPGQEGEGQAQAFTRDTLHGQFSVTKSVNSLLIGIALDQHLIRGVDEKLSAFFPEYADLFADSAKDTIHLRHLLSMTAGLSWDEGT